MPLLGTRGVASAKGFGFTNKSLKLVTVNFSAGTTNWVCPAGVTSLVTLTGKGADGNYGSWNNADGGSPYLYTGSIFVNYPVNPGGTAYPNTTTSATVYNDQVTAYNALLSAITATSQATATSFSYTYYEWFTKWPTSTQNARSATGGGGVYAYRRTTPSAVYTVPNDSSLIINRTSSSGEGYMNGINIFSPGSSGASSTGFSKTFNGGSGQTTPSGSPGTATTTQYTNVAVTPGTTYPVVNNGTMSITYYG